MSNRKHLTPEQKMIILRELLENQTSLLPVYCLSCFAGNSGLKENYNPAELNNATRNLLKNTGIVSNMYLDRMNYVLSVCRITNDILNAYGFKKTVNLSLLQM